MKKSKYKIVVLSDLKNSSDMALKSTISLVKTIGADIKFFHVKKPIDVVNRDSQLSTFRTINEQHNLTKKCIENLIHPVSKAYGVTVDYSYAFGNVKNEIQDYLEEHQPDIVVLGKRKKGLLGDNITKFVLKAHKGPILVVGKQNNIDSDKDLSIGVLNSEGINSNELLVSDLLSNSQKPLKAFKVINQGQAQGKTETITNNMVEYVFERNDNTVSNLSKYLLKSNVNLLYLSRESRGKDGLKKSDIKDVINKLDVSILLSGESNGINNSI
ncbi:universal stress protein [Algibacter sp.]|uniref:universal stress protein n=1 Tax=Algibacter sp. TaxID=1872428 RepID=UPI003C7256FB